MAKRFFYVSMGVVVLAPLGGAWGNPVYYSGTGSYYVTGQ